jgi:hypothetical protein
VSLQQSKITSPSTKSNDTKGNLLLYSKVFRTREYYWYDEGSGELVGYRLQGDEYVSIVPNARGWLWSEVLGVWLGVSDAPYYGLAVSVVAVLSRGWQFSTDAGRDCRSGASTRRSGASTR